MASGAVGPQVLPGLSTAAARLSAAARIRATAKLCATAWLRAATRLRTATRLRAATATSASGCPSSFVKLRRLRREARHSEIAAARA